MEKQITDLTDKWESERKAHRRWRHISDDVVNRMTRLSKERDALSNRVYEFELKALEADDASDNSDEEAKAELSPLSDEDDTETLNEGDD